MIRSGQTNRQAISQKHTASSHHAVFVYGKYYVVRTLRNEYKQQGMDGGGIVLFYKKTFDGLFSTSRRASVAIVSGEYVYLNVRY